MTMTHDGTDYRIIFQHYRPSTVNPGYTVCQIFDGTGEQLLTRGAAFRHIKDHWRPVVGRRHALKRALDGLPFAKDREARRRFYEALFQAKGRRVA